MVPPLPPTAAAIQPSRPILVSRLPTRSFLLTFTYYVPLVPAPAPCLPSWCLPAAADARLVVPPCGASRFSRSWPSDHITGSATYRGGTGRGAAGAGHGRRGEARCLVRHQENAKVLHQNRLEMRLSALASVQPSAAALPAAQARTGPLRSPSLRFSGDRMHRPPPRCAAMPRERTPSGGP